MVTPTRPVVRCATCSKPITDVIHRFDGIRYCSDCCPEPPSIVPWLLIGAAIMFALAVVAPIPT